MESQCVFVNEREVTEAALFLRGTVTERDSDDVVEGPS
jgi:hypothetical protein